MKKYKLIKVGPDQPFQIKALRSFQTIRGLVNAGDLGGFVRSEKNLSHDGTAWIFDRAVVSGEARVEGDAVIFDLATVAGTVKVSGSAMIGGEVTITGETEITGTAFVVAYRRPRGEPAWLNQSPPRP